MKMKKFKLFKNYSEEEAWLNQQSRAGWELVKKGMFYTFLKSSQQQLVYSIDYRNFKNKADYQEYLNLFQDSGWRHMAGNIQSGEHYFTPSSEQENVTSIFSDRDSSALRYKKKASHSIKIFTTLLVYLLVCQRFDSFRLDMLAHPSRAFLTPGLWERSGDAFWQAFLFELPVAFIFRMLPVILLICYLILMILYWAWSVYGVKQEQ